MEHLLKRNYSCTFAPTLIDSAIQLMLPGRKRGQGDFRTRLQATREGIQQTYHSYADWLDAIKAEPATPVYEAAIIALYWRYGERLIQIIGMGGGSTHVRLRADNEQVLRQVISLFDGAAELIAITAADRNTESKKRAQAIMEPPITRPNVFVGHGGAPAWRDLKDHLRDHHQFPVQTFETAPRAGLSASDVLLSMLQETNMAFLVMTKEDEMADGEWRARQNVVHEAGLFQGRYGFGRAIAVVEHGCEVFSNVDGIQQLRYTHSIREVFGEAVATIKREFPDPR